VSNDSEDDDLAGPTWQRHQTSPGPVEPSVPRTITERRARVRSNPHGIPIIVPRAASVPPDDADSGEHAGPITAEHVLLDARIDSRLNRHGRGFKKWIAGAVISAGGALGTVIVWALNAREATGAEKARALYLEQRVERLEKRIEVLLDRSSAPWRRDDPGPWAPPPTAPAQKGTAP
jgi:hypothetical protein